MFVLNTKEDILKNISIFSYYEVNGAQNSFRVSLCSDIHNDVNDDFWV